MASVLDLVKHYQHAIEKYPNDEHKILKCIDKLFNLDVTVAHLQETGVGRTVNALRKEPGNVGKAARSLVYKWKVMVAAEESDQEGDHNNDSTNYNGHGSGKDSDDNYDRQDGHKARDNNKTEPTRQSIKTEPTDHKQVNGDMALKRKSHSSEEEQDAKKYKYSETNNKPVYKQSQVKSEPESNSDDHTQSDSEDSDSESSESSEEDLIPPHKIKTEPPEHKSSSKHSSSSHKNESGKHDSQSKRSQEPEKHTKHRSESSHSSEKSSREKSSSSSKHKSSSEKENSSEKKHKSSDKDKKHREEKTSSKQSYSEKHLSSSQKSDTSSDKLKSSEKHSSKSEKPSSSSKSHKTDKEKHKGSSDKDISSDKQKSSSSSSKEKHSSSSKDKSKDRSSSSKDKSSHYHKSEKQSSDSKSKSKSEKSERSSDKTKHKSSSSKSSSKHNDDVPKKKKKDGNGDSDDGIGCESGASFAEALGMISPAKPKKKPVPMKDTSPNDSYNEDLSPASLLAPTAKLAPLPKIEISSLPEISPNYKPRPPPKFLPHFTDEEAMNITMSSKNQRTKVYSGNKLIGKIPSLYELCVNVLQEHIDALEYTGGVPYEILKPVVDKATPQQLFMLEHYNPYLMDDTDHLWKTFCEKHFRNKKRQEMETSREMYMRCQEEQESKLKSLTENIKIAQEMKKAPIKQTKMAYVDSVVKPPRNIARKQAQHGTAHMATASPAARVASLSAAPNVLKGGVRAPPAAPVSSSNFNKPKKAPLMLKTLQFMRGRKR